MSQKQDCVWPLPTCGGCLKSLPFPPLPTCARYGGGCKKSPSFPPIFAVWEKAKHNCNNKPQAGGGVGEAIVSSLTSISACKAHKEAYAVPSKRQMQQLCISGASGGCMPVLGPGQPRTLSAAARDVHSSLWSTPKPPLFVKGLWIVEHH